MRSLFLGLLFLLSINLYSQEYKVFHTAICYDLLSSIENFETFTESTMYKNYLVTDSVFLSNIELINNTVTASNLCNLYASLPTNKDNIDDCISFLISFTPDMIPQEFQGRYVERIYSVKSEIISVLNVLKNAGYVEYWEQSVLPKLEKAINSYIFDEGLLENIHKEINSLAGSTPISDDFSKIYILDIGNAFSLNDETFCCTYFLLDKEIAKKYRIDFIQVYIHENLHRLYLSKELMIQLELLYTTDEFYRVNESKATEYGEGKNEAFIVAAETYISRKLELKSNKNVLTEFTEYIEGSLVLTPIIYNNLRNKKEAESYNDFLLGLFKKDIIKSGNIEKQYNSAMNEIKAKMKENSH